MNLRYVCILLALAICGSASTAQAQYFGQNKVQYEKFDFKVKVTEHFDIYYYPEEQHAVELAARMAERWYARLSRVLRHELSSRQGLPFIAELCNVSESILEAELFGHEAGAYTGAETARIAVR